MKSSRSFCNRAVLRKNITRFAPVWALYALCLLLGMLLLAGDGISYGFLDYLTDSMPGMVVVNFFYAAIVAQVLFGDLFNTRMCNALHAMPLRRETWFVTNTVSGLLFHLVPTAVMTVLAILLSFGSVFTSGWQIPLYWFACTSLSYLAFFGIAVFSVFLAGNRLAMGCCYGMVNFASMLAYALTETLLTPLLYGVKTWTKPFYALCPVWTMCDSNYIRCNREYLTETDYIGTFALSDGWQALILYAAGGAVLLAVAMLLYRRRALECAGDFLAVRVLEPIFLTVYTLAVAMFGYLVPDLFLGTSENVIAYLFLFCGLIVGFITGKMLLTRTLRVWSVRNVCGCAAVIVGLAAVMGITALDPVGIERYIPDAEQIESVVIAPYHRSNISNVEAKVSWGGDVAVATSETEIRRIRHVHELALDQQLSETAILSGRGETVTYTISYRLKDGSYVNRYYTSILQEEAGQILTRFFNDPRTLFGMERSDIPDFSQRIDGAYLNGVWQELTSEQVLALMNAMLADADAGNMAMSYQFHSSDCYRFFELELLELDAEDAEADIRESSVVIYEDRTTQTISEHKSGRSYYMSLFTCCENTLNWVEENFPDIYAEWLEQYYG